MSTARLYIGYSIPSGLTYASARFAGGAPCPRFCCRSFHRRRNLAVSGRGWMQNWWWITLGSQEGRGCPTITMWTRCCPCLINQRKRSQHPPWNHRPKMTKLRPLPQPLPRQRPPLMARPPPRSRPLAFRRRAEDAAKDGACWMILPRVHRESKTMNGSWAMVRCWHASNATPARS